MSDKKFLFWQKWLTWANVMTLVIGLLIAFAGNSKLFEIHNQHSSDLFFEGQEVSGKLMQFKNWLFGIIGATIVGFHLLMIMISEYAFKKKEYWSYKALWMGLLSWFVIDSSISIYYGAIYNLILINLVALVMIGLPLVMTRKVFLKTHKKITRTDKKIT